MGSYATMRKIRQQNIKYAFLRHKVMFCLLSFLLVYECVFSGQFKAWSVGDYPYAYHAMDYSLGFVTRILPGAICNFLFKEISVFKVTVLETVLLLIFFVCLSFLLEKLYYRFGSKDRKSGLLLIFLFVTGPCSFGIYVKELGMLDAWWLYCAVIILFLLSNKKLRPLIVVFAFVMILIYYASVICFAPFIVIVLLYQATVETDPGERRRIYVIAAAFALIAVGSALYFMSFERTNIRLSQEEFYTLLTSRGFKGNLEDIYTIVYVVPPEESGITPGTDAEIWSQTGMTSDLLNQIFVRLLMHWNIFMESTKTKYLHVLYAFLLTCPVMVLMLSFFSSRMKTEEKRVRKFVFFCMIVLFFFVNGAALFVSTDNMKWLAHAFMLTFACFLYVLYREPQMLAERVRPLLKKIPASVLICYCLLYAVTVFHPYS